jgi:hypothetical protein
MQGWVRLWRVWTAAGVSADAKAWLVMTHLLLHARWSRTYNATFGYWLEPGQTDLTTPMLVGLTRLTEKEVRGALKRLEDRYHTIKVDTVWGTPTGGGKGRAVRVITFERWHLYQNPAEAQGGPQGTTPGTRQGGQRAAEGQPKGRSIRLQEGQETSVPNPGEDVDPLKFD